MLSWGEEFICVAYLEEGLFIKVLTPYSPGLDDISDMAVCNSCDEVDAQIGT